MAGSIGRRRFVALATAAVGAPLLAGCGDGPSSAATSTRYGPDAWRTMFSPIGTGQSEEFQHYDSLGAAVRDPQNLVVRVAAGRNVRVVDDLGGETDAERWLMMAADLPIIDVLAGDAPGATIGVQLSSFDAPDPGDAEAAVAAMARALDELGPGIWVLQNLHVTTPIRRRLATSQCLFVEKNGKMTNPMYPGGKSADPVAEEAMAHKTLDGLATAIERIASG